MKNKIIVYTVIGALLFLFGYAITKTLNIQRPWILFLCLGALWEIISREVLKK